MKDVKADLPMCACGCGKQTMGGKVLPGHDSRILSAIIKRLKEAGYDGGILGLETVVDTFLGPSKFAARMLRLGPAWMVWDGKVIQVEIEGRTVGSYRSVGDKPVFPIKSGGDECGEGGTITGWRVMGRRIFLDMEEAEEYAKREKGPGSIE